MLERVGKRLFILLPAIWLIASAVFLLSRTMPGGAPQELLEQQGQSLNSKAKAEARRAAYRQLLRRTGQDLPLFYFTFGTAAEPDTLHRIFPENERQALQHLVLKYGNWPGVSTFYHNWQGLQQAVLVSGTSPDRFRRQLSLLDDLLPATKPEEAAFLFQKLKQSVGPGEGTDLLRRLSTTEASYGRLVQSTGKAASFMPVLHWHGTENQYHRWFSQLLQGHLGYSSRDARPVSAVISEAFGLTFGLAFSAFILIGLLAPEIAMVLSRKSKRSWRAPILGVLYSLESLPMFLVALLVLGLASAAGWLSYFPDVVARVLAVFCLVAVRLPYLTGQSYAALQNVLQQPYMLAARAKGLAEGRLLRKHALRNSLLPVITLLSDLFPALLAGSVVLEVIFSLPGMGRLLVNSVLARDHEIITGLVLLTGLLKMGAHLLADVLYVIADPRLRSNDQI
ncbi:MAG TPA: ABC transporter permease [Adhaeribacter sp.]|nr:ABC transporter permease [Adhaeribacter sp.]